MKRILNLRIFLFNLYIAGAVAVIGNPALAADQGYFVSVDGLQPDLLFKLNDQKLLSAPRGFSWLLREGYVARKAQPAWTTITAPSHISTITCSPPSRHGIISNNFMEKGKSVSGFAAEFYSEPLWIAAQRQGKKVLSLAYVGADGSNPRRRADYGLAYPDNAKMGGAPQVLNLDFASLPLARGWKGAGDLTRARETSIAVTLNPKTREQRSINVLVKKSFPAGLELWFDGDKDLQNGYFGVLRPKDGIAAVVNAYFTETTPAAPTTGIKRRVYVRFLSTTVNTSKVYVSRASYNNAYPEAFRRSLDAANLVWPDYAMQGVQLAPGDSVTASSLIDRFLAEVAEFSRSRIPYDILLFYQPLIDSTGHLYQGRLPVPFNPHANEVITQAFVKAFKIVDENLSRVFAQAKKSDVIALMGDHGMDASKKALNLAEVLSGSQSQVFDVVTSGGLAMLYPKFATHENLSDADKESWLAESDRIGAEVAQRLSELKFDGKPVIASAFRRKDTPQRSSSSSLKEWQYGEAIWAFVASPGIALDYLPFEKQLFVDPPIWGAHGHPFTSSNMATSLLFAGAGVAPRIVEETSLLNAVPTFMSLLGLAPPRHCVGKPLLP